MGEDKVRENIVDNGNQGRKRLIDEFQIRKIITKLLIDGVYINKPFLCKEYGWGCREWAIAQKYLHSIEKKFDKFFKDVLQTGRLQGSLEEIYNKIVDMFVEKFKVPPVMFTGQSMEDEDGVYIPASYVRMTYNEFLNRKNKIGLKGLRDTDTKLHNILDKGMPLLFLDQEKELITSITGILAEPNSSTEENVNEKF